MKWRIYRINCFTSTTNKSDTVTLQPSYVLYSLQLFKSQCLYKLVWDLIGTTKDILYFVFPDFSFKFIHFLIQMMVKIRRDINIPIIHIRNFFVCRKVFVQPGLYTVYQDVQNYYHYYYDYDDED